MKAKIYIDKGEPFVSVLPETLTDKSQVWNLKFRNGDVVHCLDESRADAAFAFLNAALQVATGEPPLLL